MKATRLEILGIGTVLLVIAGAGWYGYHLSAARAQVASAAAYKTAAESDRYVRFDMEAYDSIVTNYWQQPTDADMAQLFQQSLQKALSLLDISATTTLPSQGRAGTAQMLASAFSSATSSSEEEQMAVMTLQVALYNIPPAGRDQLLSQTQQAQLRQEVSNINPSQDLYSYINATSTDSQPQIDAAYEATKKTLAASSSPQAQRALAQAAYAHEVLSNTEDRVQYDQSGIQPTVFSTAIGKTLYIYISRMSPTTLNEFQEAVDDASSTPGLDSMIIDLRGNLGGSLADAASFIGYFQGLNQYAFDLLHQGSYNVVRTDADKLPELARYGDVALLTDGMTQSTAEVITAAFKRFHLGRVVGATTRGWGTVENTYPLTTVIDASTTYALLLVNSITLRDDNQPVQGNGVVPDVSISDANWKSELPTYFRSSSLIAALKQEATAPPIQ